MGSYLASFRVPPPTPDEDERNHPYYYDWSQPEELFRKEPGQQSDGVKIKADVGKLKEDSKKLTKDTQEALKSILTSTVDASSRKPADLNTHVAIKHEKSEKKTTRKSPSITSKKSPNIKAIDSSRPQTIDAKKYGNIDDQAAAKAATNLHNIDGVDGTR